MPAASAPSTSSSTESPTMTASRAATPSSSSAAAKMSGLGFTLPWLPEETQRVDVEAEVPDERAEVAARVRDEAELQAHRA